MFKPTAHNRAHELVFIHTPSLTSLMGSCDAAMRMPEPALVTRLYANNLREPQVHEEKIWYKVHEKDELGRTVLHYIAGGLTDNRGAYYEGASNVALERLVFMEADVDAEDVTGKTALHYLVDRCWESPEHDGMLFSERDVILECIAVLLQAGANPNAKDMCGLWPVARAVIFGAKDVLDVFESEGKLDLKIKCETDGPVSTKYTGVFEPLVEQYWLSKNLQFRGCTVIDFAKPPEALRRSKRERTLKKEW